MKLIEIKDLNYKKLKHINITIQENTITTIYSNNNQGKTTLLKILSGKIKINNYTPPKNHYIETYPNPKNIKPNKILTKLNLNHLLTKQDLTIEDKTLLELSKILSNPPKLLLIDETLENLNPNYQSQIKQIIKSLNITIITTTSDPNQIQISDQIIILDQGQIILTSTTDKLINHENLLTKHHIPIPFTLDLSNKLKLYNLLDKTYISNQSLVNSLWK